MYAQKLCMLSAYASIDMLCYQINSRSVKIEWLDHKLLIPKSCTEIQQSSGL